MVGRLEPGAVGSDPESEQGRCETVVGVKGGGIPPTRRGPVTLGPAWLAGNPQTPLIKETKSSTCLSFYMSKMYFMVFLFFFLFQ